MNLIQQENRCRAASAGFGVGSTTLPKSGKRRVCFIASSVNFPVTAEPEIHVAS